MAIIHGKKRLRNQDFYLVEWVGYPNKVDWTWEPRRNLTNVKEVLKAFEERSNNKSLWTTTLGGGYCYDHITPRAQARAGETPEKRPNNENASRDTCDAGGKVQVPPKAKTSQNLEIRSVPAQRNHKSRSIPKGINPGTRGLSQEQGTSNKWGNSRRPPTANSHQLEQRSTSNPVGISNQMRSHGCTFHNLGGEAHPASNHIHTTQQHVNTT